MTRKTSFYFSFLVLPRAKRRAVTAVYDLCRAIDDSVDLEPDPVRAAAALDSWRVEVARLFEGRPPETPQGRQLLPFIRPFNLPRIQFDALIEGVAMDITPKRYSTFADLEKYCHRVASAVGLVCAEIFGYREAAVLDYARDLGVALQLTNILRDVAVDARQRRLYLPLEDFERFGCTEADLQGEIAPDLACSPIVSAGCSSTRPRGRACSSRARHGCYRRRTHHASCPPRSCGPSMGSCSRALKRISTTSSRRSFACRARPRPAWR
jgi:phytoene synthase